MDNLVLFCGNHELNEMHALFSELLHTWDDLVDKDKEVTELEINRAFLICFSGFARQSYL
jgi:hypothetical protein